MHNTGVEGELIIFHSCYWVLPLLVILYMAWNWGEEAGYCMAMHSATGETRQLIHQMWFVGA